MPRTRRQTPGGYVYHPLNRAVARLPLFQKDADYHAFLRILDEAQARYPIRTPADAQSLNIQPLTPIPPRCCAGRRSAGVGPCP
jgi:hypothetical protein